MWFACGSGIDLAKKVNLNATGEIEPVRLQELWHSTGKDPAVWKLSLSARGKSPIARIRRKPTCARVAHWKMISLRRDFTINALALSA
jgi:hypothetical protein